MQILIGKKIRWWEYFLIPIFLSAISISVLVFIVILKMADKRMFPLYSKIVKSFPNPLRS